MQDRVPLAKARRAAMGLLALLSAGCSQPSVVPTTALADARPAAHSTVVAPQRMTIRRMTEEPGQIEAIEITPIHAKLAGYVRTVTVDLGDQVKKGQVMAELRVPELEAELKSKRAMIAQAQADKSLAEQTLAAASAAVATAQAKVAETQASTKRAEADTARWQSEFTRTEQLVRERAQTGILLEETRNKLRAAEGNQEEIQARVRSAEAGLAEARAVLDRARAGVVSAASRIDVARFDAENAQAMASYARIEAPYDGIVTRRNVDTGQLTTPGTAGEPLFVVARHDFVTISVGVPETEAPFVNSGDPARVRLLAFEGRVVEGKVARTSWALDPATRTLRAEIDLPNPDRSLRPGLYAYATIIAEEHANALTVPATAVFKDAGKSYCVRVQENRARRIEVQVGLGDGKRTEIMSGLSEDSLIVETGASSLADGQELEPVKSPEAIGKGKS